MKVTVFKKEEQKEREVKLMLYQEGEKVFLSVVNENGTPEWHLLSVSPDGIYLYPGLPSNLGFKMSGSRLFVAN